MSDEYRYDLWYVPEFPLDGLDGQLRAESDSGIRDFLRTLEAHIRQFGLRFPIGVHVRPDRTEVRPGKCRVTALRRLGYEHCPAIVADYTRPGARPAGWVRLPYDAQSIQRTYFDGSDSVVEVSRRFFSIKKLETIRRPGVEDQFSRELRLHGP